MTHASWNNERGRPSGPGHDNERLEYLGDAVLELVVGEYLFKRFPEYDEGQLTQLRAALVNTSTLARLAERLHLGEALFVGKGAAKTGARRLPSLLANSFEAMIGAIFLDQGYRVATRVFLQNIGDLAEWSDENFKGKLQEAAQERTGTTPTYRVTAAGGPGHKREYVAEAVVGGEVVGSGRGTTKQAAEQAAAQAALQTLGRQPRKRVAGAKSPARRAAGAAREAVRETVAETPRVRRRVAEVAADRSVSHLPRERGERAAAAPGPVPTAADVHVSSPSPSAAAPRRRGLLSALRSAAEALVGRVVPPEPPPMSREERHERRAAPPIDLGFGGRPEQQRPSREPAPRRRARPAGGAGQPGPATPGAAEPSPRGESPAQPARRRRPAAAGSGADAELTGRAAAGASGRTRRGSGTRAGGGEAAGAPSAAPPTGPSRRRRGPQGGAQSAAGAAPQAPSAGETGDARRSTRRGRRGGRGRRKPGTPGDGGGAEGGQS